MVIKRAGEWVKTKAAVIALFVYGLAIGTSTPLLLSRCTSGGGCGNCAGFCGVALGIMPLVVVVAFRNRVKHLSQRLLSFVNRVGRGDSG